MRRRGQCILLLVGTLGLAAAWEPREAPSYAGPADPWPVDRHDGYSDPRGHPGPYGAQGYGGGGYGGGHGSGGYSACKEGFYGQCKKDNWGRCINPGIVGLWELTDEVETYGYSREPALNSIRWLMQVDEYDFCKQSGNYRVTNLHGLIESEAYGTYVWADKNLYNMRDYAYVFEYSYPHSIANTVVWDAVVAIDGYGDRGHTVKPSVGITKDLYGQVSKKEVSGTKYTRLAGPYFH